MISPIAFRDLTVWKKAVDLVTEVYRVSAEFPADERLGMVAQMRRAAISIAANIAEGNGRSTRGEYLNHLSMARGSLNELRALFTISVRLGYATDEALNAATHLDEEVGKMLTVLRARLRTP